MTAPPKRWVHRLPVRVRQYWRLLAVCVTFLMVMTVVVGTERIRPYVTSSNVAADDVTVNITGNGDLFDSSVAHDVTITFRDADYQRMLDAYFKDGEKNYVEADLTVDGVSLPSVGIRLKGNSTLGSLTRNGQRRQGGFGGRQGGGAPGNGGANGADGGGDDGGAPRGGMGGGFGGMGGTQLKAEQPETLPWLISFDEFVKGRRFQGHRQIAVRVGGMGGGSTTVLNEAVSLDVLAAAGEVTEKYAYAGFTVNGRSATRLLISVPDEVLADELEGPGVLYKALASSSFTDQGDDPVDYQDDFQQITMKGSQDLGPVIDLVQWVNSASDAEFDAHLAEHVDVESFSRYAAVQNLLLNMDDMAGPGRNYYLWYDLTTKKFSVVGWDYNLTLSGSATAGPHDQVGFGGAMRLAQPADGQPGADRNGQDGGGGQLPEGIQLPEGMQLPGGGQPPGGGDGGDRAGQRRGFGGMMGGNRLKERFLASKAFTASYENAYRALYRQIYAGGRALAAVDEITQVMAKAKGYDVKTTAGEAERLRTLIRERTESLAKNPVIAKAS